MIPAVVQMGTATTADTPAELGCAIALTNRRVCPLIRSGCGSVARGYLRRRRCTLTASAQEVGACRALWTVLCRTVQTAFLVHHQFGVSRHRSCCAGVAIQHICADIQKDTVRLLLSHDGTLQVFSCLLKALGYFIFSVVKLFSVDLWKGKRA